MLAPVPVREFLEAAVSVVRRDPALAHVSIDVSADDSIVKGDAGQLQQALLNLLINGAQAMQGQGRLRVTAVQESGSCAIRITDEGPGIPAEVREHLFEPFFTTKHRGTGLGLATARRILDSHGGSLTLECPPGGGTTAVISVPLAPA